MVPINPLPDDKILDWSNFETNCRQHFKVHLKWKISTMLGRKNCEKRRNCLLQAISPFLTVVFHSYISLVRQNVVLCGNGLKTEQAVASNTFRYKIPSLTYPW